MKRLLATILALVFLFSLAGCDKDPTGNSESVNNGSNSGSVNNTPNSSETVIPGEDDVLNEDGSLKVPAPEATAQCTVDAATWQSLLAEDAIRSAMKDNSLTMLTSDSDKEQYQMFFCAGGRYGSIQNGSYRSEIICAVDGEKVYIYKRDSEDAPWTRTESRQSYDEYVTDHYFNGAMQFLSGLASVYDKAQYSDAEKAYSIQNHTVTKDLTGTLNVQFSNGKLHSIALHLNVDGQTGDLTTVFGTVSTPEIPADFQDGPSAGISGETSNQDKNDHHEPMESVCSEAQWKRLFGQNRLLQNLMEFCSTVRIDNNRDEYLYQMDMDYSRIVISSGDSYQELLISREARFQRNSRDGQWTRYADRNHHKEYETILADNTKVLAQLLTPLANLYGQVSFDAPTRTFMLEDVAIEHETFGSVKANYVIVIRGDRIEKLEADIRTDNDSWTLTLKEGKGTEIKLPTDYVDMSENTPGKK